MNNSLLVLLTEDENITTVECVFTESRDENYPKRSLKRYTYKTSDKTLKEGDMVIVECAGPSKNNGLAIVKVVATDVEVDFSSDKLYRWVVSKIDLDAFQEVKFAENALISQIKSVEKQNKKQQLITALGLANDMSQLKLENFKSYGFKMVTAKIIKP